MVFLCCLFLCQGFGDVSSDVCSLFLVRFSVGKELLTLLAICSLCILTICNFRLFPALVLWAGFGF